MNSEYHEPHQTYNPRIIDVGHYRVLSEGSAIGPDVIAARGVRTVSKPSELPDQFSARQKRRAPGILFVAHRPNGERTYVFRPDETPPDNPEWKYEQIPSRNGGGNFLDVHPFCRKWLKNPKVPVFFVEGIKKADSLLTAMLAEGTPAVVVAVTGCWNWLHAGGKVIPDMFDIPLGRGRKVVVCFDSDMLRKWQVQEAARRLASHLESRGAKVYMTFFEDGTDGSKVGADDFFVAGGTFAGLRLLTRRYDPADFKLVRLSRNGKLRGMIDDLWRTFWCHGWSGMGGHSARDVFAVAIEEAAASAAVQEDGLRVRLATRAWSRRAKVSSRTLQKCLNRLEDAGLGYRDNKGRKADEKGAFVLRASVNQYGTRQRIEQNVTLTLRGSYGRGLHLRVPRLRWTSPGRKSRLGTVKGTRKVRQGPKSESRPTIKRLGKIRGAVVDALCKAGGSATIEELCRILHRKRARDLRRRTLPMLEETGIISVDGGGVVSLTDEWLERLEEQRKLGRETEADEREERRHRKESYDYRKGLEAIRRSHEKRRAQMLKDAGSIEDLERVERDAPPELVAMLKEYLRLNPRRRDEKPSWFAVTLWAEMGIPKPAVRDVELALYELRRKGRAA